jgi:hypothetical protein
MREALLRGRGLFCFGCLAFSFMLCLCLWRRRADACVAAAAASSSSGRSVPRAERSRTHKEIAACHRHRFPRARMPVRVSAAARRGTDRRRPEKCAPAEREHALQQRREKRRSSRTCACVGCSSAGGAAAAQRSASDLLHRTNTVTAEDDAVIPSGAAAACYCCALQVSSAHSANGSHSTVYCHVTHTHTHTEQAHTQPHAFVRFRMQP